MGIPRAIPDYLRAWERVPEAPCHHDSEKPCVPCLHRRLHNRRWSEQNPERRRELVRGAAARFRERHADRVAVSVAIQKAKPDHKVKVSTQNRAWVAAHPERHRELNTRWREANREKTRASIRQSRLRRIAADPEGVREKYREDRSRRRARLLGATVGPVDPAAIYERDSGLCSICGLAVPRITEDNNLRASLDHVVPLARGGSHDESNVSLAHALCNSVKHVRKAVPRASIEELRTRIAGLIGG